jgi:urea transporter
MNNPVTGFIIFAALIMENVWVGFAAVLGTAVCTLFAMLIGLNPDSVRDGVAAYCPRHRRA